MTLKKTSLNDLHKKLLAKMVDFGGWEMPLHYPAGILSEHLSVRSQAGLFDVSHMGEFIIRGAGSIAFLDFVLPTSINAIHVGQIKYSALLAPDGTFIDDLLVYRLDDEAFMLVVNASNIDVDFDHLQKYASGFDVELKDVSTSTALLAVQGPRALEITQELFPDLQLSSLKYYSFSRAAGTSGEMIVSRTGYTGEDGFEIYCPSVDAQELWTRFDRHGSPMGLVHVGLGARNTLRLEAGMALYGHEISRSINPIQAGLKRILHFDKATFLGRDALVKLGESNNLSLVGLKTFEKRDIPRDGMKLFFDGAEIGWITSAGPSPTLAQNIGLGYIQTRINKIGTRIQIQIRDRMAEAELVPIPFYRRLKV